MSSSSSMPTNDAQDNSPSMSFLEKMSALLEKSPDEETGNNSSDKGVPAFWLERQLAAWVLMTSLGEDELKQVWNLHHSSLEEFARSVLLSNSHDDATTGESSRDLLFLSRYLRLIAQVTARLTSEEYPMELGTRIFEVWKTYFTDAGSSTWLAVSLDAWSSLEVFLNAHPAKAASLNCISTLWQTYMASLSALENKNAGIALESSANETANKALAHAKDFQLMGDTLDQILNRSTGMRKENDEAESWHELVLTLITQTNGGNQFAPSDVPSLLRWIVSPAPAFLDASLQTSWKEWLWSWISSRIVRYPMTNHHDTPEKTSFSSQKSLSYYLLKDNVQTKRDLQHLLLAHVTLNQPITTEHKSPLSQNDNALRAMAWQTLVSLVEINGWDWMILSEQDTIQEYSSTNVPRLGNAKYLCAWIRLASGEWRIQLQQHSSQVSNGGNNGSSQQKEKVPQMVGVQSTAVAISVGCARILQSIVQFCIRLANQPHLPMPLSSEELLHLRKSLEQALCTTVEYISVALAPSSTESEISAGNKPLEDPTTASLYQASLKLLGSLLMEIDIFTLLETPQIELDSNSQPTGIQSPKLEAEDSAARIILECLRDMLPSAKDPALLPGLVHILGLAEDGGESRQELVRLLLEDSLLDFFVWYWKRDSMDDTLPWACTCVEQWLNLVSSSSPSSAKMQSDLRRLRLALVHWMQRVIQSASLQSDPSSIKSYLSLALGCYMTLSKDRTEEPKEHESRVVLRALKWCEEG